MKKLLINFLWISIVVATGCSQARPEEQMQVLVDRALEHAERQSLVMAGNVENREGKLPKTFENGELVCSGSSWWCSGFFPGVLWYLYEADSSSVVLRYARLFTDRLESETSNTRTHDLGFMINCSFGNGYRLTGDAHYRTAILEGAASLATRFNPSAGVIRSWDFNRERWQFPVIIDNMMNLELLLEASQLSGDAHYREIAVSHADKTLQYHFRDDGSSFHVVSYDTLSWRPHLRETYQGFSDDSAWSRGQAWGLYGYTYMYRYTHEVRYLQQARRIARFLLDHPRMPSDGIPYWDLDAPDIPAAPRDASAAAVMASALLELSGYVDASERSRFLAFAEKQIRTLSSDEYTAPVGENGGFILRHSVGFLRTGSEVDAPLTYADYYYVEALVRMKHLLENQKYKTK